MSYRVEFDQDGKAFLAPMEFGDWREAVQFVRDWNGGVDQDRSAPTPFEPDPIVKDTSIEPDKAHDHHVSAPLGLMPANDMVDGDGNYINRSSEETRAKQSAAAKANFARKKAERSIVCDVCGKEFPSEQARNGHKGRAHGRKVVTGQELLDNLTKMVEALPPVAKDKPKAKVHSDETKAKMRASHQKRLAAKGLARIPLPIPIKAPQVSRPTPQVRNGTPQVAVAEPVVAKDVKCEWLVAFKSVCEFAERGDWAKAAYAVCQDSPWSNITPGQVRAVCERFREHALNMREAFRTSPAEYQALKLKVRSVIEGSATNGHIQFYGTGGQGS